MFARFNNYDQFYNRFERHNGQLGASFELPLFTGKAPKAAREEANVEAERLRLQRLQVERKAALDTSRKWREREDAWAAHEVASLELEAAREHVGVLLARSAEGRATLVELEQARVEESQRWAEFYRSRAMASLRDLELLSETGALLAYLDGDSR
jgi:outer membrane protein TolC